MESTETLSRVFAALADPTRRLLVASLAKGDATVGELAAPLDMTLPSVSKHLKVLQQAGLVTQTRDQQRRPCSLNRVALRQVTVWAERYLGEWEEAFSKLDDVLAAAGDPSQEEQT